MPDTYDFVRPGAGSGLVGVMDRPWTAAQNLYTIVLLVLVIGSVIAVAVATSPFTS